MSIALTGANGLVGRFVAQEFINDGLITLGRKGAFRHWDLNDPAPDLSDCQVLIHCAFAHLPGKYRGGEGTNPAGFLKTNLSGSRRLFDTAAEAGIRKIIFLSSRAVLGGYPAGSHLPETAMRNPDSLYGEIKAQTEEYLAGLPLQGINLRATGVYGPSSGHKWHHLFDDYLTGRAILPKRGTEVHGADLARAIRLLLRSNVKGTVHISDILLDRRDLLEEVKTLTLSSHPLPPRARSKISQLDCTRLHNLGWKPGGLSLLRKDLHQMLPAA